MPSSVDKFRTKAGRTMVARAAARAYQVFAEAGPERAKLGKIIAAREALSKSPAKEETFSSPSPLERDLG